MKKLEMLHSKLNKTEKWCLYCFMIMIFCYSKVNDIKGTAVLTSQIPKFIILLLQILLFYMKEKKTRKRETNTATGKIDMTELFDKFLTTYKQTHVSVKEQQSQMECSKLWRETKKGKENAVQQNLKPKTYVSVQNECKKRQGKIQS